MTVESVWIVGFTGHRPGDQPGRGRDDLANCHGAIREALQGLNANAAARGGRIELFTGLAAGADLEAAEAASELGIAVHVILPMAWAEFAKDFRDDEESKVRAQKQIDRATSGIDGGTMRVADGSNNRPDCYHEQSMQQLSRCDLLLTVWNGEPERGIGGTAETIEQARRLGLPIIVVDPRDPTAPDGVPRDWPTQDSLTSELNDVVSGEHTGPADESKRTPCGIVFDRLDRAATDYGKKFRGRLVTAMALHFVAAIIAATTATFAPVMEHRASVASHPVAEEHAAPEGPAQADSHAEVHATTDLHTKGADDHKSILVPKLLTGVEFLLVLYAWWIMWRAHRGHVHELWRQTRFATEICRGIRASAPLLDPLDPLIVRHAPEWRRFAMSYAVLAYRDAERQASLEDRKTAYIRDRLEDQAKGHFGQRLPLAAQLSRWLSSVAANASAAAPLAILAALALKLSPWHGLIETSYLAATVAYWLPIALPLFAGSAISFLVATDSSRRAERYRLMVERLEQSKLQLPALRTPGAVSRAVAIAEDIMVDEIIEWYVASKNVGH